MAKEDEIVHLLKASFGAHWQQQDHCAIIEAIIRDVAGDEKYNDARWADERKIVEQCIALALSRNLSAKSLSLMNALDQITLLTSNAGGWVERDPIETINSISDVAHDALDGRKVKR